MNIPENIKWSNYTYSKKHNIFMAIGFYIEELNNSFKNSESDNAAMNCSIWIKTSNKMISKNHILKINNMEVSCLPIDIQDDKEEPYLIYFKNTSILRTIFEQDNLEYNIQLSNLDNFEFDFNETYNINTIIGKSIVPRAQYNVDFYVDDALRTELSKQIYYNMPFYLYASEYEDEIKSQKANEKKEFLGWHSEEIGDFNFSDYKKSFSAVTSVKFDAILKDIIPTITLKANGGIFKKDNNEVQEIILETNELNVANFSQPTKDNYSFKGWSYSINPLNEVISSTTENISQDIILYAQWQRNNFKITYKTDKSGVNITNMPEEKTISYNEVIKISSKVPQADKRYVFNNWIDSKGNIYIPNQVITHPEGSTLELVAQWKNITYECTYIIPDGQSEILTFSINDGDVQDLVFGQKHFTHWSEKENDKFFTFTAGDKLPNRNITLYAVDSREVEIEYVCDTNKKFIDKQIIYGNNNNTLFNYKIKSNPYYYDSDNDKYFHYWEDDNNFNIKLYGKSDIKNYIAKQLFNVADRKTEEFPQGVSLANDWLLVSIDNSEGMENNKYVAYNVNTSNLLKENTDYLCVCEVRNCSLDDSQEIISQYDNIEDGTRGQFEKGFVEKLKPNTIMIKRVKTRESFDNTHTMTRTVFKANPQKQGKMSVRISIIEDDKTLIPEGDYTVKTIQNFDYEPFVGGQYFPNLNLDHPQNLTNESSISQYVYSNQNLYTGDWYKIAYANGIIYLENNNGSEVGEGKGAIIDLNDGDYEPENETQGVGKIISCIKGQTYTMSVGDKMKDDNWAIGIAEYNSIKEALGGNSFYNGGIAVGYYKESKKISYTAKTNGILICGVCGQWTGNNTNDKHTHICSADEQIQVELGTEATDYVSPALKQKLAEYRKITPDYPLYSLLSRNDNYTYQDNNQNKYIANYIDVNAKLYYKNIGSFDLHFYDSEFVKIEQISKVLEMSQYAGQKENYTNFRIVVRNAKLGGAIYCNRLPVNHSIWSEDQLGCTILSKVNDSETELNVAYIDFTLPYSILNIDKTASSQERLAALRGWLTSNSLIFYYELNNTESQSYDEYDYNDEILKENPMSIIMNYSTDTSLIALVYTTIEYINNRQELSSKGDFIILNDISQNIYLSSYKYNFDFTDKNKIILLASYKNSKSPFDKSGFLIELKDNQINLKATNIEEINYDTLIKEDSYYQFFNNDTIQSTKLIESEDKEAYFYSKIDENNGGQLFFNNFIEEELKNKLYYELSLKVNESGNPEVVYYKAEENILL